MKPRLLLIPVCLMFGLAVSAWLGAPSEAQQKKKPKLRKLTGGLDNPCGIAVQPETQHLFIATRRGVIRFDRKGEKKKKRKLVIRGYPTDIYGKGPKYEIGPLGLAFIDSQHLVVGDGSRKDGKELVRIYEVGMLMPQKAVKEDQALYTLGPIPKSEQTTTGEGNFYGVAVGAGAIFVSCNGDDTKGWVAKAELVNGKPGPLKLAIATKVATGVDAPVPLTFTPDGKELVVGQMGEINLPKDSLLTFYDPATGKLKRKMKTGLYDITGLAYSPRTGKLYATDFAWMDTKKGGLYRLDVEGDSVTATKIFDLDKPTALAFDRQGRLYITVLGTADPNSKKKPGAVYVVTPGL